MPHLKLTPSQSVQLQGASFTIGADPSCDLPLSGRNVLPRHLILQSRGDKWQAATLALRAPVFINDRPMTSLTLLHDGDRIRVGDVTFVWREQPAPQAGPWKGLLLIFLAVMTIMSALFAYFSISDGQHPPAPTAITTPAPPTGPGPVLQGYSQEGHPIYRIQLPPSTP